MVGRFLKISLIFIFFLSVNPDLFSQFYNGHQMKFGKNRVQYNSFYWKFYRFERYDVYSYDEGTELSLYVADYIKDELPRIERFFDYKFEKRLILITYNKQSDFKQSNIGQIIVNEEEEANIGGVTRIIQNKIFLFFDGDHNKLEQQITQSLSEALIYEMLYGNDFKDNFTNSTLLNLPEWYIPGLVSYISNPWDFELENRVKDGIINDRYKKFNRLEGIDALYAGHSFWKYISDTYGKSIIPNILYITRINKNSNYGFLYVLGMPLKDLSDEWLGYYFNMYMDQEGIAELPDTEKLIKRPGKNKVYTQVKLSPDGDYLAYVYNEEGRYKIFLHNLAIGKRKKLDKEGYKIEQISDYSYPVLTWHPTSKIIAWVEEYRGEIRLSYYDLELDEYNSRIFVNFEKILDLDYSDDGLKFVISGVRKGQTDIFIHDIVTGTNKQITDDIPDDLNPRFFDNSRQIIFTSNRKNDSLNISKNPENIADYYSVFLYDTRNPDELRRMTERDFGNRYQPFPVSDKKFLYLSDNSGIINRYFAKYDSAIAFIDTSIHYNYFARSLPLTNYRRNIFKQDFNSKTGDYVEVIFHDGLYNMYMGNVDPDIISEQDLMVSSFRTYQSNLMSKEDSINNIESKIISMEDIVGNSIIEGADTFKLDFNLIDINNYVFEKEKLDYYNNRLRDNHLSIVMDTVQDEFLRYIDYETSFYPNYMVSQVDFSFLNESYQAFTGGAVYFNPGFNMQFKVGASDLFEDIRIIGGARFATDFNSNEFLLSFEDLKTRWDKQVIFHRQVFNSQTEISYLKTFTHEMMYIMKFPLDEVKAIRTSAIFRNDHSVYLSTDLLSLNQPDIVKPWAGLKVEYIHDDTRSLGLNLYQGTRYKLFAEAYNQIDKKKADLVVLGADFRHYLRLHRTLIWANRFAASSSFGNTPLIYYLGSVDNWTNLSTRIETFDKSVPIDYTKNYAFQTVATNMRGFSQNIRNGSNFALINSELRWPLIRYIFNRPLSSSFLNNFQLVGFVDAGTAWTGLHPWSGENEYDSETYVNGPIEVVIDSFRDPLVAGYGFGVRSRVFGYFLRLDWAWGIENQIVLPRIFYFSLNLDF
ncbi:MAG: PD40 domain-containing protein [Bacteroidales bacterium]|nr:PD40 domain-containing protein [Bacteroidales bacterium]